MENGLGGLFGLPGRMAMLIVCGNSAIAPVAPVIGVCGRLSRAHYGALAGPNVYAVPHVLAATAPCGAIAMQVYGY
jgi:uncharacterized membrane protein YadS